MATEKRRSQPRHLEERRQPKKPASKKSPKLVPRERKAAVSAHAILKLSPVTKLTGRADEIDLVTTGETPRGHSEQVGPPSTRAA